MGRVSTGLGSLLEVSREPGTTSPSTAVGSQAMGGAGRMRDGALRAPHSRCPHASCYHTQKLRHTMRLCFRPCMQTCRLPGPSKADPTWAARPLCARVRAQRLAHTLGKAPLWFLWGPRTWGGPQRPRPGGDWARSPDLQASAWRTAGTAGQGQLLQRPSVVSTRWALPEPEGQPHLVLMHLDGRRAGRLVGQTLPSRPRAHFAWL